MTSYSVTVTDANGCVGSDIIDNFDSATVPETPLPITGQTSGLCGVNTITYSVDPVDNADYYVWAVPEGMVILSGQGTTSITVDASAGFSAGIIEVLAANDCGASPTVGFDFPVAQLNPEMPETPTGPTTIPFSGVPYTYSVSAVDGATSYMWTVPAGVTIVNGQGSTSIDVIFDPTFVMGDICVDAENACGVSFCCLGNCIMVESAFLLNPELEEVVNKEAIEQSEVGDVETEEKLVNFSNWQAPAEVLELRAYPNPSAGQFFIEGDLLTEGNLRIQVFSLLGKAVYQRNFGYQKDTYWKQEINAPNLPAGTYLVYVVIGDQSWNTKMIILE